MDAYPDPDDPYYRLYRSERGPVVVCLQWFDVWDYDERDWLTDEQYATEAEAEAALDAYKLDRAMLMDVDAVEKMLRDRIELGLPFPPLADGNAVMSLIIRLRHAEAKLAEAGL